MVYKTYIVLIERFAIMIYKRISASSTAIKLTKHGFAALPRELLFYYLIKRFIPLKFVTAKISALSVTAAT